MAPVRDETDGTGGVLDAVPAAARKGRGAASNATGRYEANSREAVDDGWGQAPDAAAAPLRTQVTEETARRIIATNDSPDVPFEQSINPYRGCEHGCVYCYARPSHAYVGLSPGLDFESRLFAKTNAAERLRAELATPGYRCRPIVLGANTDPYQPVERRYRITRQILELLAEVDHPVGITTKSAGVLRDLDLLAPMAAKRLIHVGVSVTTLDPALARTLEPRASSPARRLDAVRQLSAAGVPVTVMASPMIPFVNDAELERILEAGAGAGACFAAYILLRLPLEVKDLFAEWLANHAPDRAERVLARVRDSRGGKLYDPDFATRMRGTGAYADALAQRFRLAVRRLGLDRAEPGEAVYDTTLFRPPAPPPRKPRRADGQLSLF